jgi:hypothetical protein
MKKEKRRTGEPAKRGNVKTSEVSETSEVSASRQFADSQPSLWQTPGFSHYLILCLACLALIVLLLRQLGLDTVGWFVVAVGIAGVVWRWRMAPIVMLAILAVGIKILPDYPSGSTVRIPELLLSGAVLGFVAAHYRLQSLTAHIFPPDPRRREGEPRWQIGFFTLRYRAPVARHRRAPQQVTSREIGQLLLSLPVWAILAQMAWRVFPSSWGNPGMPLPIWRAICFAWIIGLAWFGVASFIDYRWRREMKPEEAGLFLQDIMWRETRREQARIVRWSAWFRLRRRRQEENKTTEAQRRRENTEAGKNSK